MRINFTSVLVDDQDKALAFYTGVLGFVKKEDVPLGEAKWLNGCVARGARRRFTQEPATMGEVTTAVLDDTCGNLIQFVGK